MYLQNRFGGSIPELNGRLTEKQQHYVGNRRGPGGEGGRLRTFTEKDLEKLEREAEAESSRVAIQPLDTVSERTQSDSEHTPSVTEEHQLPKVDSGETETFKNSLTQIQQDLLEEIGINVDNVGEPDQLSCAQVKYITQYCENMVTNGNKRKFAVEVGKAMVILFNNDIESVLPEEVDINGTVFSENDKSYAKNSHRKVIVHNRI
ncbi:MAG: hypothetical protein LBF25_01070 [Puniceicoccales bacterium]|nr:hypothetical protein [Puniceicoccales bacterium]